MIQIRDATVNDVEIIHRIAHLTWMPAYQEILDTKQITYMLDAIYAPTILRDTIISGDQQFILLTVDDVVKGFAAYAMRKEDPLVCKLHKLYVLGDQHAKGYGRALVEEVKTRLMSRNVHILELNVNRQNKAKFFYQKAGFEIIREEDIPIGPYYMNDYVMRLTF